MIAYVVPDGYTVGNTDEINNAYVLKLTKEVTKLFGGSRIVTVYEQETGITYILPDSVRDLFADQSKNSCPANGSCASASDDNDCSCGRTYEFSTLRLEFGENAMYRAFYDKELLLKRYVLGLDKKNEDGTLVHFLDYDIENAGGFDKNGKKSIPPQAATPPAISLHSTCASFPPKVIHRSALPSRKLKAG